MRCFGGLFAEYFIDAILNIRQEAGLDGLPTVVDKTDDAVAGGVCNSGNGNTVKEIGA